MDDDRDRDLLTRARQVREAAHVSLTHLGEYIGAPARLISLWERQPPDMTQLSRRDQLAVGRWLALLQGLDRDQGSA